MADSLYLSLWFRDSELEDLLPHGLRAMQQFLYSKGLPGIAGLSIHPVSWNEATILEQRYRPGIKPEEAVLLASDLLHEDYGYVFEANWDLWTPESGEGEWHKRPTPVKFIARAQDFEEGEAGTQGEIQVDFGLDTPFLHEELRLTSELESRVRANVQLLVDYINRVEANVGAETRLLWSESDENLAQKLISRLQRVQ
ncbi:MAG TPA: hypothetical protein VJS37_14170 [Terriglobales bacterium]|nr:hypothetical protein [Terriglobales bacterium]